jgi:hypothetical protein
MLSQSQFEALMTDVVEAEFPDAADAFAEQIGTATTDFYAGKTDRHLSTPNDSTKADFQFSGAEVVGALPIVISSLTIMKLAAEAFLAIRKAFEKDKGTSSGASTDSASEAADTQLPKGADDSLQSDLTQRLQSYLPEANAAHIAAEIVSRLHS